MRLEDLRPRCSVRGVHPDGADAPVGGFLRWRDQADLPDGAPEQVVRTVTENSRTLKFTTAGFERE